MYRRYGAVMGPERRDATDAIDAIDAIRRVLALYCQLCDDGRFADWAELFAGDARFHVMGRTAAGRAEIRAFIEGSQPPDKRGRHVISLPLIALAPDGRAARAWTDYVFVDRQHAVMSVGRYHDELELADDGRWRFALREVVFVGDQPELAQPPPPPTDVV
jgi:3-phenylpropionate/cinnamic acid dioxygenase small subunit